MPTFRFEPSEGSKFSRHGRHLLRWLRSLGMALLAMLHTLAHAAAPESTISIDLSGAWKWQMDTLQKPGKKGDNHSGWQLPTYDDSKWESLRMGTSWESQGKQLNGIAWYRKTFDLGAGQSQLPLQLLLGSPDDGCEVYLNGQSLGVWKFREQVQVLVPPHLLQWNGRNTIAVRVWDWYKQGGIWGSEFAIRSVLARQPGGAESGLSDVALNLAAGTAGDALQSGRWQSGWRDEGTSNTQPGLQTIPKAFRGQSAVQMDVWYPNSTEFLDYELQPQEAGSVWSNANARFVSFWYRTDTLSGDISIRLSEGKNSWRRRAPVYQSLVRVKPGDWTEVILPLNGFTRPDPNTTQDPANRLGSPRAITHLSIGYGNHHLAAPGKIQFAAFKVASSAPVETLVQPIDLSGAWLVRSANNGLEKSAPALVDLAADGSTGTAKRATSSVFMLAQKVPWAIPRGQAAWFETPILVPQQWRNRDLRLQLGRPSNAGAIYWNNKRVRTFNANEELDLRLPQQSVKAGVRNLLTVYQAAPTARIVFRDGPFQIAPYAVAGVQLAEPGSASPPSDPETFEMGVKPPQSLDLLFHFALNHRAAGALTLRYEVMDCFDRTIASGTTPLGLQADTWQARVTLDAAQSRTLFYGEWFRTRVVITDEHEQVLLARAMPEGSQRHYKLRYHQRDVSQLPDLPPTSESTPQGLLRLVDVIDTAEDADRDPHPYKEGGIRNGWTGRRANLPWVNGVVVNESNGEKFREASNNQFFAYRIGRGKLTPHKAYLLRIRVPDDKSRYVAIDIKAGRNSQGTGYRTQTAFDTDPPANPFSGKFLWYDHIVINDDVTYGYQGPRDVSSENGFWVVFHDIGRAYASAYDGGPAVAQMRLYELPDDFSTAPRIDPASQRILMMDWERQPEAPPQDVVRYAKLLGLNAIAPSIQKWAFNGLWHSQLGFAPSSLYKTDRPGEDDRDIYGKWLAATRKADMKFIPRIEYGGGPQLPKEAWVVGPDGEIDRVGRYANWGANLLHPATLEEMKRLIDELIGQHVADNPQLAGLLWRQRQDRLKCSYGQRDIALFKAETGAMVPAGDAKAQAQWASRSHEYAQWWQGKRARFLLAVRDHLRHYRADLALYYYNWDEDGFDPPIVTRRSANDWSEIYNVDLARNYARRVEALRDARSPHSYVDIVTKNVQPHLNIFPDLFRSEPGIHILAPISRPELSGNAPFLNFFNTHDGAALSWVPRYEEKGRWNMQWDDYESSELTPGPGELGMLNEQKAVALANATVITSTTYTYGRGWITEFRKFAEAFLDTK
jgi:hypothetical protein